MCQYPRLEIIWLDSGGHGAWHSLAEAKKARPLLISSMGYLIYEDETRIVIAASMDNKEPPEVADETVIPRFAVSEIWRLRLGKKRNHGSNS